MFFNPLNLLKIESQFNTFSVKNFKLNSDRVIISKYLRYFITFLKLFKIYIFFYFICLVTVSNSQTAQIFGTIKGTDNNLIEGQPVIIKENSNYNTLSNELGNYSLQVESGKLFTLMIYGINYVTITHTFIAKDGEKINFSPIFKLKSGVVLDEILITDIKKRSEEIIRIDPKNFNQLPSPTGNIEDLIKTQIGVTSNNELSSGYSVRGGNFDENLVYVNDIEIYRPFLVRSGQQEGLSFANPNMVQNINFSAGGFEAKYGDKMSSVLDITYRKPLKFGGNASASFLGGNFQLEGVSPNHLIAWNIGARYRSNIYLLKSLDTDGEYKPSALDVQSFLTFDVNSKLKFEFLTNIANNSYLVVPTNRETTFGTVKEALKLTVYFDGQELMQYTTFMAGLNTTYRPNSKTKLNFIGSAYNANEQEIYTIQGQYYIDQLEADLGKPNFGQVAFNRGVGTFLNNGRNHLTATVINFEHKGHRNLSNSGEILWGLRQQFENIEDRLGEWKTIDSAGYIVPYSPSQINLIDVYKTKITLPSNRSQAYVQYNFLKHLKDSSEFNITTGIRANYWSLNEQIIVSPRVTIAFKPNWLNDWLFKFSTGFYYQPVFYRELRNIDGSINKNIKAQQSIHFILTSDYNFKMWGRPFKLIISNYYKQLNSIIPYEVDNVRIRYFANNNAKGYALGSDLRINGEFVKGVESWASLGFLRTYEYSPDNIHYQFFNKDKEEIIKGYTFDQVKADSVLIDPGYIPRPTNQLLTFGLFFQDYLPKFPSFKFNLNLQFGSGLPFGPPTHFRWQQILLMPPYRRVDAGFAYNVIKEKRDVIGKNIFNNLKEMWVFVEIFNLLQLNNTVSYTWISDVTGNKYAIPNYLTNRQVNVRLQIKF